MTRVPKMMAYALDLNFERQEELGYWDEWGNKGRCWYKLNTEVHEWVEENIPPRYWKGYRYKGQQPYAFRVEFTSVRQVQLIFWDEQDILLFKMRWWP